jgi:hypothetical protein
MLVLVYALGARTNPWISGPSGYCLRMFSKLLRVINSHSPMQLTITNTLLTGESPPGVNTRQHTRCTAMIRLLCTHDHGWYVANLVEEHNHHPQSAGSKERSRAGHEIFGPGAK